ncbi:enoyl-CoA hydratase [Bacillus sp. 165]|uniref:enoyl-CoA hydratase n=1 Tax=Bacillus sp. 165 TaxID=1529117 RepID=UPI001AD991B9|nr:enoyl-CoA hydratase [Bacillus sp. 165]MBO9129830.1 enoyl-CoA hydratase [Bacillus sp. 165]
MYMQAGTVVCFERTFTKEDVLQFAVLSGDRGNHHMIPDEQGRLMAQGLLTATLPTKIGGDYNFIAREIKFTFLRPVFTGDIIRCEVTVDETEQENGRLNVLSSFFCVNQHGKEVLNGKFKGVILQ